MCTTKPGLGLVSRNFPEFLDADGKALRVAALVKLELADQLFAEVTACAFGEYGVLA